MRRTKHVTSPYGVVTFSRVTAGILLLFSAAAVAKMSPAPVGRHREELYTADRRSPSFAGDFEAHMRPFFESKLKSGTALRRLPQEQYPRETDFLARYDQFRTRIEVIVDMPDRTLELLFRFLRQNGGRLSRRAREGELAAMTDAEVASVEQAYADLFF